MQPPPRSTRRTADPRRWKSSGLLLTGVLLLTLGMLLLAGVRYVPGSPLSASSKPDWSAPAKGGAPTTAAPSPTPELKPLIVRPTTVKLKTTGWYAWSLLDMRTGKFYGSSDMDRTNSTASLVKAWIAADYLRRAAEAGQKPNSTRMHQLTIMIRDSDNDAAIALWPVVGKEASTKRMIKTCGLTDSRAHSNWSLTQVSPRDIARLGACIAKGRAAGPKWTKWLLNEMRLVRGVGDFGVRKAFPQSVSKTIAIKNGWVVRDETSPVTWHVNCLAIGDGWTMGVTTRYPPELDYTYGAKICKDIASQLRAG